MLDTYAHDLERFEREGGYTFAPQVDAVLHGLGFDPVEARTWPLEPGRFVQFSAVFPDYNPIAPVAPAAVLNHTTHLLGILP